MSNFENIIEKTSQSTILDKLNFVDKALNGFYSELEQMAKTKGVEETVDFLGKIKDLPQIQNYFFQILKVFKNPSKELLTKSEIELLFSLLEETFLGKKLNEILSSVYDEENERSEQLDEFDNFDDEWDDDFSTLYYVPMTWAENLHLALLKQIKEEDLSLIASNMDLLSLFLGEKNIKTGNQHWANLETLNKLNKNMTSLLFESYINHQKSCSLSLFSNPENKNELEYNVFKLFIEWCFESTGHTNGSEALAKTFLMNLKNIPTSLIKKCLISAEMNGAIKENIPNMLFTSFGLIDSYHLKENEFGLSHFVHHALLSIKPYDFYNVDYLFNRYTTLRNILGSDENQEISYKKTMKEFLNYKYLFAKLEHSISLFEKDVSLDSKFFIDFLTQGYDVNSKDFEKEVCTLFLQDNMRSTIKSLSDLLLSRKDLSDGFQPTLLSWLKIATEEAFKPNTHYFKSFFVLHVVENLEELFPMVKEDFDKFYLPYDLSYKFNQNYEMTNKYKNLENEKKLKKEAEIKFNEEINNFVSNLTKRFKDLKI